MRVSPGSYWLSPPFPSEARRLPQSVCYLWGGRALRRTREKGVKAASEAAVLYCVGELCVYVFQGGLTTGGGEDLAVQ